MKHAETVTFGGSRLDRAAQLRPKPEEMRRLLESPGARILPIWRGKPAMNGAAPSWIDAAHPAMEACREAPLFLGRDGDTAYFAAEIPDWATPGDEPADVFLDPGLEQHPALPSGHPFTDLRSVMADLSPREAELAATARALLSWHETHGFCARCGSRSDMIEGGWQRLCPACGTRHFPRTDPVVIMLVTHGNSLLLGRSPGWIENMYSLLAGFVEPGETIEAAVRREAFEETGVRTGAVRYLASQPWPFPASLMIGCHAEATSTEITVDPLELEDALWISREDMAEVLSGTHHRVEPTRRGSIARFLIENWLADRLD